MPDLEVQSEIDCALDAMWRASSTSSPAMLLFNDLMITARNGCGRNTLWPGSNSIGELRCDSCWRWFNVTEIRVGRDRYGRVYQKCPECNDMQRCRCGEWIYNPLRYNVAVLYGLSWTSDRVPLCEDCRTRMNHCRYCGRLYDYENEDMPEACPLCIHSRMECENCGEEVWRHEMTEESDGTVRYCNDCAADLLRTCRRCGSLMPRDAMHYNGTRYTCGSCRDGERHDRVAGYHDTDREWFLNIVKGEKDPVTFGVELEIFRPDGDSHAYAEDLYGKFGKIDGHEMFFMEEDGSLCPGSGGGDGFEIVFQPMTLKFYEAHLDHFSKMLAWLTKMDFVSYEAHKCGVSCGIHISIGRGDHISPFAEYKLQRLFYENPWNVLTVSQRRLKDLKSWGSPFGMEGRSGRANNAKLALKKISCDKYCALNFRRGGETIECRVFRGTLNIKSFSKNLEFLAAAVDFARSPGVGLRDATWAAFMEFSRKEKEKYKNWILFADDTGCDKVMKEADTKGAE